MQPTSVQPTSEQPTSVLNIECIRHIGEWVILEFAI